MVIMWRTFALEPQIRSWQTSSLRVISSWRKINFKIIIHLSRKMKKLPRKLVWLAKSPLRKISFLCSNEIYHKKKVLWKDFIKFSENKYEADQFNILLTYCSLCLLFEGSRATNLQISSRKYLLFHGNFLCRKLFYDLELLSHKPL